MSHRKWQTVKRHTVKPLKYACFTVSNVKQDLLHIQRHHARFAKKREANKVSNSPLQTSEITFTSIRRNSLSWTRNKEQTEMNTDVFVHSAISIYAINNINTDGVACAPCGRAWVAGICKPIPILAANHEWVQVHTVRILRLIASKGPPAWTWRTARRQVLQPADSWSPFWDYSWAIE